jgi:hypothetical protein
MIAALRFSVIEPKKSVARSAKAHSEANPNFFESVFI